MRRAGRSMSLTTKFEDEFTHRAREEGAKLYSQRLVKIEDHEPQYVDAVVQSTYGVSLTREKGAVRYSCDCDQYLQTGAPCKHVWATLLSAELNGYTEQWETSRQLDFVPEDEDGEII